MTLYNYLPYYLNTYHCCYYHCCTTVKNDRKELPVATSHKRVKLERFHTDEF